VISFVVPAYNEEKYLGATLASIHDATKAVGEPYEIVVANDASTDGTVAIAEQGAARVVHVQNRQIAATRNAGAKAALGDILIFVDADTRINEKVVRAALAALNAGAVGGGCTVRMDEGPLWAAMLISVFIVAFRWLKLAAGCFIFVRREAFEAVAGFDETYFAAEEIILSHALKRHGRFVSLREEITTSGRKVRNLPFLKFVWMGLLLAGQGPGGIRNRRGTHFWYDGRR